MPDRKAETLSQAMINAFADFPTKRRRSFTFDHGNEFFKYAKVEKALETKIYLLTLIALGKEVQTKILTD